MALSCYPIARCQSLNVSSNFQNNTRIAITRVSRKTRFSTRFTPVFIIVYLGSDTDGRILVLYEHAIIRNWRKFILSEFDSPVIGINQYLWFQGFIVFIWTVTDIPG